MSTKPAFGKLPGYKQAAPLRAYAGVNTAPSQQAYAPPQLDNYADIVGNAFQGGTDYDGFSSTVKPVKGLRFLSTIIDFIVLTVVTFIITFMITFVGVLMRAGSPIPETTAISSSLMLILIIVWFGYGIVMESSKHQGTVGKILTGTVVVNKDGRALSFGQVIGRNCGKIVSACAPVYLSYMMVFFTQNNQSLHDKMSQTYVYKKSDLPKLGGSVFD